MQFLPLEKESVRASVPCVSQLMVIDVCATPTINKTINVADFTKSNAKRKQGLYFPGCLDIYLFLSLL